jgi:hypothetical protein
MSGKVGAKTGLIPHIVKGVMPIHLGSWPSYLEARRRGRVEDVILTRGEDMKRR